MRFGLYLPSQGPFADVALLAGIARDAEAAGWDGFFIWDEIVPVVDHSSEINDAFAFAGARDVADAFIALTAVAAATARIRIGALVSPAARLRPEVFAHQAATLQRFSGGRLIVAVGLGSPDEQFSAFGFPTDPRVRAEMLDEFLDVVTRLWSGEDVLHRGTHFTVDAFALSPPVAIPVWIGGGPSAKAPRRRAARWDGFVPVSDQWPDGVLTPEQYADMRDDIAGRASKPIDLVVIGNADGTAPNPEQIPSYADAGATWVLFQALTPDDARRVIDAGPPS